MTERDMIEIKKELESEDGSYLQKLNTLIAKNESEIRELSKNNFVFLTGKKEKIELIEQKSELMLQRFSSFKEKLMQVIQKNLYNLNSKKEIEKASLNLDDTKAGLSKIEDTLRLMKQINTLTSQNQYVPAVKLLLILKSRS